MSIRKAKVTKGLKLHQGDVRGLKRRGLKLERLNQSTKGRSSSGGRGGQLTQDDSGTHFRGRRGSVAARVNWFAPPRHPFQVYRSANPGLIAINRGYIQWCAGSQDDTVSNGSEVASTTLEVAGVSTIYLEVSLTVSQYSTSGGTVGSGGSANLYMHRVLAASPNGYVSDLDIPVPLPGSDTSADWAGSGFSYFVRIADITQRNGHAVPITQYITSEIWVPAHVDAQLLVT